MKEIQRGYKGIIFIFVNTIQIPVGKVYVILKMIEASHGGHGRQLRITNAYVQSMTSQAFHASLFDVKVLHILPFLLS